MTILISEINKFGVIFAADRNVTYFDKKTKTYRLHSASPKKKLISVREKGAGRLGLVVGCFGLAEIPQIKGKSVWTHDLIHESENSCQGDTIGDFCAELSKQVQSALDNSSLPVEERGIGFHIGGFVEIGKRYWPTFWYLSNLTRENDTSVPYVRDDGKLNAPGEDHFVGRDAKGYLPDRMDDYFTQHGSSIYFNGMIVVHNVILQITQAIIPLIQKVKNTYGQYEVELQGFGKLNSMNDHQKFIQITTMITRDFYATYSSHQGKPIGGNVDIITIDTMQGLKEITTKC